MIGPLFVRDIPNKILCWYVWWPTNDKIHFILKREMYFSFEIWQQQKKKCAIKIISQKWNSYAPKWDERRWQTGSVQRICHYIQLFFFVSHYNFFFLHNVTNEIFITKWQHTYTGQMECSKEWTKIALRWNLFIEFSAWFRNGWFTEFSTKIELGWI